jgi:hypothetical protein
MAETFDFGKPTEKLRIKELGKAPSTGTNHKRILIEFFNNQLME